MIAPSVAPRRPDPRFREGPRGLELVPPAERCACGQRDWTRQDTRWFCRACWRLATAVAPSDAELATARTAAETARLALAIAEAQAHTAAVDQVRTRAALGVCDAKRLASLRPAWQAALLHRLRPARYPRTPAAARWLEEPVLELVREFARCHAVDPKTAGPGGLARLALEGGPHDFVRVGYETVHDFAGLLDNVAQTTFVDAYGDVTRSFEPWTSAVTVADFRSTIGTWNEFPDLREVPEHGEYVAGSPFGPAAPVRLTTFGRIVGLTRQALLRDDLATAGQLVQALGVAAAHVEAGARCTSCSPATPPCRMVSPSSLRPTGTCCRLPRSTQHRSRLRAPPSRPTASMGGPLSCSSGPQTGRSPACSWRPCCRRRRSR